ncbi:MAG: response regulator [Desulfuromonas sp.]|uniref:response regulator n=1 Tax=Desulfuromonas sp. TaxID=892 RepID=UPI000CBEDCA2|nr:response regulator [Desulfuromonas sp.]PLX84980.1 MAG: response regulator [Desulfuromonas sp.]
MKRIVIADDSDTARMFIRRCLEIIGLADATFVEAANGKEALEKVKEAPTDLLLTDLHMPVMDGIGLLTRVKASPLLHDLPVLVVTSAGNEAQEKELMVFGAFGVLSKPVSPAAMMEILEPLMQQEDSSYVP